MVVIHRTRLKSARARVIDPAAPVLPSRNTRDQYDTITIKPSLGLARPRTPGAPKAAIAKGSAQATSTPAGGIGAGGIIGWINRLGGSFAAPAIEIITGAWFAFTQAGHVIDVVAPGAAQLSRADGSGGAIWHGFAALAGAVVAAHGTVSLLRAWQARKQSQTEVAARAA